MKTDKLNQHTRSLAKNRVERLNELKRKMGVIPEIPAGWMTARQIAERLDVVERTALNLVYEWARLGKCETRKFQASCGLGEMRRVPHYRFDPEVAKALELGKDAK